MITNESLPDLVNMSFQKDSLHLLLKFFPFGSFPKSENWNKFGIASLVNLHRWKGWTSFKSAKPSPFRRVTKTELAMFSDVANLVKPHRWEVWNSWKSAETSHFRWVIKSELAVFTDVANCNCAHPTQSAKLDFDLSFGFVIQRTHVSK